MDTMATHNAIKNWDVRTKPIISQLLHILPTKLNTKVKLRLPGIYANYLPCIICIFMNINENIRIMRKKWVDLHNQTGYHINATTLYILVINRNASNLICIIMSNSEDIRNERKQYRKMKTKLAVPQLITVLCYQTRHQMNAEI